MTALSKAVTGYAPVRGLALNQPFPIGVLTGEGIGPEIIAVVMGVLKTLSEETDVVFDIRYGGKIGKDALAESGASLTDEVVQFCKQTFDDGGAVLCGPGGARFVYLLRRQFDLFCKLVPLVPTAALADVGVLRPTALADVDVLVVRENVSGLYFGDTALTGTHGQRVAQMSFSYEEAAVARIIRVACQAAQLRRGKVCVIYKPGATGLVSELWASVAAEVCAEFPVEWQLLEVDNASYQMVANARSFDVVVAPNMFGDVLADGASVLLASRGMSFSANYGPGCRAVYQTGHGAAHDLAGRDVANPLGQLLSAEMMLRESFGLGHLAGALRAAISDVLAAGWRTRDIAAADSKVVGTQDMGARVIDALKTRLAAS